MNGLSAALDTSVFSGRGPVGLGGAPPTQSPLPSLLCLWGPLAHQCLCQRMAEEGGHPRGTLFLCIRKWRKRAHCIRDCSKCSEINTFGGKRLPVAGEAVTQGSLHPGNGTCKSSFKVNSSRGVGFYILFLQMGSEKVSAEVPQELR